jgi:multicomponent Na+:H+ antiporter subunit D
VNALVALPLALPLLGAAVSVVLGRWRPVQRLVTLAVLATSLVISVVLVVRVEREGIQVSQAGGWPAPFGISLVVDRLSAVMLVVSSAMLLAVALFAIGEREGEGRHVGFHPVYLVLAAGVAGSFVTGDLFNLFVCFEMMLVASYVLITLGGRPDQIRAGMTYVVISLVASIAFVTVLGLVYSATGTVNMADLSTRIPELDGALRTGFAVLLLGVFGIKAGLFPLFSWLPDSYPTAPGPVTAIFAGLLTKVGVYAIIRTQTLLIPEGSRPDVLILVVAGLTMVIGVLGAIAQDDMKRILSFHIVSQIGYMVFGLGLFTVAGLAGAVFFLANNIVLKTSLLLVAGIVDRFAGSCRLSETGGLVRRAPVVAVMFGLPALSLAGLPPFSGFVAKLGLVDAGVSSEAWAITAVSLAVSLFTTYSMTKIWAGVFWGERDRTPSRTAHTSDRFGAPPLMLIATGAVVAMSLAIALFAGPLWDLAERIGADLVDPSGYVEAVLGGDS